MDGGALLFAANPTVFVSLTWRVAVDEGVPDVVLDAGAHGVVVDHVALGVDAAHVPARVLALVGDARLVGGAVLVDLALVGAASVRVAEVALLALAHAVGAGAADVRVGAAGVGHAGVLGHRAKLAWAGRKGREGI